MKKGLTEVIFVLDKSGSMMRLVDDTIGGFNSMIEKQKEKEGEVLVSTVLFDNRSYVLHDRVSIEKVKDMTNKEYYAGGSTALVDALYDAIRHIENVHKYIRDEDRPEHTMFVVITDGYENSSFKYTSDKLKKKVENKKESGWEFVFLGANIDAVDTGETYGFNKERSINYVNDSIGVQKNFECISEFISCFRDEVEIDDKVFADVKGYYNKKTNK